MKIIFKVVILNHQLSLSSSISVLPVLLVGVIPPPWFWPHPRIIPSAPPDNSFPSGCIATILVMFVKCPLSVCLGKPPCVENPCMTPLRVTQIVLLWFVLSVYPDPSAMRAVRRCRGEPADRFPGATNLLGKRHPLRKSHSKSSPSKPLTLQR